MLNVSIELLVYSVKNNAFYLLSTAENELILPYLDVSKIDPNKLMDRNKEFFIEELLSKHVYLDHRWLNIKLIDYEIVSDGQNIMTKIFYGCMVPFDTKIYKSFWINSDILLKTSSILKKL
jgi:hypothetical protein